MDVRIIRLTAEWAEKYRAIRLEALQTHPEAYVSSYEEEAKWPIKTFQETLRKSWAAGLLCDGELSGIAVLFPMPYALMKHKARLAAVYVRPAYKGQGLGRRLIASLLEQAADTFEQVSAAAVSDNLPALRLYESLGFERFGYEKHAAKLGDKYFDDIWLVKFLK